jgi:hypothetical protein
MEILNKKYPASFCGAGILSALDWWQAGRIPQKIG